MNNLWSELPNAMHIDWVIQSVKDNPDEWNMARSTAWDRARDWAYDRACDRVRDRARYREWYRARNKTGDWSRDATWDVILALLAYDDSEKYLDMTYEELKVWATLSEDPASILLLPMVKAKELIEEKMLSGQIDYCL
jgi:hypothetical protein